MSPLFCKCMYSTVHCLPPPPPLPSPFPLIVMLCKSYTQNTLFSVSFNDCKEHEHSFSLMHHLPLCHALWWLFFVFFFVQMTVSVECCCPDVFALADFICLSVSVSPSVSLSFSVCLCLSLPLSVSLSVSPSLAASLYYIHVVCIMKGFKIFQT